MIFKSVKKRLMAVEERLTRTEGELKELKEIQRTHSKGESHSEISCAGLIDEWVNGREEK